MGKTRTLANTVSTGGPLADGAIGIAEVTGLQAALDATGIKSGTAITTNGQSQYNFSGIPASVKNIKLMFRNVSVAADQSIQLQLGTAGGQVTTGYTGTTLNVTSGSTVATNGTSSTAFFLAPIAGMAATSFTGIVELCEFDTNVWVMRYQLQGDASRSALGVGEVSLGGELTNLRLQVNVTTFDGGTINILYE